MSECAKDDHEKAKAEKPKNETQELVTDMIW